MTKVELRARMREAMAGLEPAAVSQKSARIAARLARTAFWRDAEAVLVFLSMPGEVDTAPIIRAARAVGKLVAAPRVEGRSMRFHLFPGQGGGLKTGGLGIRQPPSESRVFDSSATGLKPRGVLAVVPGLAFDRRKNRLGRGKGYYDRFLRSVRTASPGTLTAVAVCFSLQLLDAVPSGAADQRVDCIITEEETVV
jgi:5-formyltetrahydrofolate cyclo-ligase